MTFTRLTCAFVLLLGAGAPVTAHAETAPRLAQADTSRAALLAERQRVRDELERANAEIDALKRSGRGLRGDYRLRERLADAEALARRLTELDARLGTARAASAGGAGAEPRVSPNDGPAELDAKADILADQAQRLASRGDALLGRARDLRARQALRRRVGQLERDPFSPLEGSKRRAMTGSLAVGLPTSASPGRGGTSPVGGVTTDKGGSGATLGPPAAPTGGATTPVDQPQAASSGGANTVGAATTASPAAAVSSPTAAPSPTSVSASDTGALSVQLRELLDPTTLAEIQHLEATGGAGMSLEALERAGAALKARAERLRLQAAALRASEHDPARAR